MGKANAAYQAKDEQANHLAPCTQKCCLAEWGQPVLHAKQNMNKPNT